MYLLTIARAEETGHRGPLPITALAERLDLSTASANEMVHRLDRRGLVTYQPYRGAGLTAVGREIAYRVLRVRRLWASFLADHLGLSAMDADTIACRLEHVTPVPVADRLAGFLGNPSTGPLGRPIEAPTTGHPLAAVPAGSTVGIVDITSEAAEASFLASHGIVPGARITIEATGLRGVVVSAGTPVGISTRLATTISVTEA